MLTQNNYTVYKHIAPNGKVYIGITSMIPCKRWQNGNGYRQNIYFTNAILKYGWENIQHIILYENLTKAEAEQKEIELIKLHNSTDRRYGYNIENGGNATGKCTLESRKKMSISHKGVPLSEAHKAGLRIGRKKRKIQPNTGKHLTEEWKKAVSKGLSKAVKQYDLKGNYIATYSGQLQASKITKVCSTNISRCCKGERKQAGGYLWRFADDNKNKRIS